MEKICRQCGGSGDVEKMFHKSALSKDGFMHTCKACREKDRSGNNNSNGGAGDHGPRHPTIAAGEPPIVTVDLNSYGEVFQELLELAEAMVRTPEQQALFILKEEVGAYHASCFEEEIEKEES